MQRLCQRVWLAYLALVLIAPGGWCCFLAPAAPAETEPVSHCPHCPPPEPADSPDDDAPREPNGPMNCPCLDRQATAPVAADELKPVLHFAPLSGMVDVPAPASDTMPPARPALASSPPLHLLHCLWLC